MTGKTHFIGGVALGLAVAPLVGAASDPVFLISVAAGSLFPDICHPSSKIGRKVPIVSHLVSLIFGHRTFTHSLVFLAIVGSLLYFLINPTIAIGVLIGMASHLLLDACTNNGIALFFPLRTKVRFPITLKTGGLAEGFILAGLVIITGYLGYENVEPLFKEINFFK